MMRNRWSLPFWGVALAWVVGSSAEAVNFLSNCSPNGILLKSEMVIGYHAPPGPFAPVIIPPPAPLADLVHTIPPTVLVVAGFGPPSGIVTAGPINKPPVGTAGPKDTAVGTIISEFGFAVPYGLRPMDSFRLRAFGTASAVQAFDAAMAPADAVVQGRASAEFFVDNVPTGSPLPPPPNCAGSIFLPPLRALAPHELALTVTVLQGTGGAMVPIFTQGPGTPAATVALPAGFFYRLELDYYLRVPHGVDPAFDVDIEVGITEALPVPSFSPFGLALVVLGIFALGGGVLLRGRAMIR